MRQAGQPDSLQEPNGGFQCSAIAPKSAALEASLPCAWCKNLRHASQRTYQMENYDNIAASINVVKH